MDEPSPQDKSRQPLIPVWIWAAALAPALIPLATFAGRGAWALWAGVAAAYLAGAALLALDKKRLGDPEDLGAAWLVPLYLSRRSRTRFFTWCAALAFGLGLGLFIESQSRGLATAMSALERNDYDKAIALSNESIKQNPEMEEAFSPILTQSYFGKRAHRKAILWGMKALSGTADDTIKASIYGLVWRAAYRLGDMELALKMASQSKKDFPSSFTPANQMAITSFMQGNAGTALKEIRRAISLAPSDKHRAAAEYSLGWFLFISGDAEARAHFETAAKLGEKETELLSEGYLALMRKEHDEAESMARQIIETRDISFDDSESEYFLLALALEGQGNPKAAFAAYEKAVAICAGATEAVVRAALAADKVGMNRHAREYAKRALELNPAHDKAATLKRL